MIKREYAYLLLAVAAIILYFPFSDNPLQFDDLGLLRPDAHGRWAVENLTYSPFDLRALPYASFAWSKALWGGDIRLLRLENLLLHTLTAFALFGFMRNLMSMVDDKPLGHRDTLAFLAALFFVLHPVSVYGAAYLVQRTILMATLFALLMLLCWFKDATVGGRWRWGAVGFYFLAVTAKEHAVMLPAVGVALTILLNPEWRTALWQRRTALTVMAAIAVWVILAKQNILGAVYEINAPRMLSGESAQASYALSVLTQCALFFKYLLLWVAPNPRWMSGDMREPFAEEWMGIYGAAAVAFIAWGVVAMWLVFRRGRAGLLGFAMLFPWLLFFTEFSAVRVQESFVLYRSYLWASGAFVAVAVLMGTLEKKFAVLLGVLIVATLVPASMDRLASFSHPLVFWDDAVQKVQGKEHLNGVDRIYYNRGLERLKIDDYDGAISDFAFSIRLNPSSPFAYGNLGLAFEKKGMWRDAVIAYGQTIQFVDQESMSISASARLGRGRALEAMGRADDAQNDFRLACQMANKGCDRVR